MAGAPPPPLPLGSFAGTMINGAPATKVTASMTTLSALPILRHTIMRPNRVLLVGTRRVPNEESWLATQVGELQVRACRNCAKGNGPFTDCVVVPGRFKEACTNCYYGGTGSRCTLRHDHENAVAHLQAGVQPAPIVPGMAPAFNFGGQMGGGMGGVGGFVAPPGATGFVPPQGGQAPGNVPRGGGSGGARRIAPLLVGPLGSGFGGAAAAAAQATVVIPALAGVAYGPTRRSRLRFARSLNNIALQAERIRIRTEMARLRSELFAVEDVIDERDVGAHLDDDMDGGLEDADQAAADDNQAIEDTDQAIEEEEEEEPEAHVESEFEAEEEEEEEPEAQVEPPAKRVNTGKRKR
ncbi:3ee1b2a2-ad7f-463b-b83f-070cfaa8e255 [Sclerotinia trifoliorum]|uniref:3ee1b2a2-ad7f-463b-b83f-070cfaa8e255 n=1 Tax=Sclerotinia trifoliorum TaxID=28548 RepID=A0A8H2VNF3_9HELO|nr:3ee1b2a2-ad7f-463b-b83f-070cfaa8e255 [Sclerotinia trifoliorum]